MGDPTFGFLFRNMEIRNGHFVSVNKKAATREDNDILSRLANSQKLTETIIPAERWEMVGLLEKICGHAVDKHSVSSKTAGDIMEGLAGGAFFTPGLSDPFKVFDPAHPASLSVAAAAPPLFKTRIENAADFIDPAQGVPDGTAPRASMSSIRQALNLSYMP
uniref:Uncharacterized protein n=1 Tax=Chromera velia CCMP2878 TaxID=1169474 RepID=A0A0G4F5N6_9ALVE|eukprot:Cvel_15121.t1-p1 / transcript=Cvel_15121.t1 / gene=Cvel_15121 / organism=Chromera_velia_CCMP2878 / gene_product=hypothetical protein / transcript_product=hypothetical protein / location=Cvel_scaffold1103:46912-47394(-) / protein_length=161 / sequence_SO=supercontig / SO=protein_coding / is_pseudo=false